MTERIEAEAAADVGAVAEGAAALSAAAAAVVGASMVATPRRAMDQAVEGAAASSTVESVVLTSRPDSTGHRPLRTRTPLALLLGIAVLFLSVLLASFGGAADLPFGGVALALLDKLPFVHADTGLSRLQLGILDQIRLPRVILATLVGALLAQAGAAYQGVFRNPLSDSGLIGASAGAGMAATLVIVFGGGAQAQVAGIGAVPLAAFVGALGGVLLSYLLGAVALRGGGTATLILAGVAVSSFFGSVQAFVMQSSSADVKRVYSWLFGDFSSADWGLVRLALPYAVISVLITLVHAKHLDVLALGDDEAATLGLHPARTRLIVLGAASLATATAVAVSGIIGFVGLVVPHMVRRVFGPGHRLLLPMSLLVGGAFLVLADLLARTVLSPAELPIGVVTSFFGGPFFVLILRATRKAGR
jgi:iron complex transport system permease protein